MASSVDPPFVCVSNPLSTSSCAAQKCAQSVLDSIRMCCTFHFEQMKSFRLHVFFRSLALFSSRWHFPKAKAAFHLIFRNPIFLSQLSFARCLLSIQSACAIYVRLCAFLCTLLTHRTHSAHRPTEKALLSHSMSFFVWITCKSHVTSEYFPKQSKRAEQISTGWHWEHVTFFVLQRCSARLPPLARYSSQSIPVSCNAPALFAFSIVAHSLPILPLV